MKMKTIAVFAAVFVAAGLAADERLLAHWFTVDGEISSAAFLRAIRLLRAALLLLGIGLLPLAKWAGPARVGRLLSKVALLLFGTLFSLALAEAAVRMVLPTPFALDESLRLFQYHERLGHEFIPGKTGLSVVPFESKNRVTINSHGMRSPETAVSKKPGVRRLAVLGDSFTSNLPVPLDHLFTVAMGRMLGDGWEVLNFGVDGYTTLQEWMQFEEKVAAFEPDAVMVLFYLRNDLDDNRGFPGQPNYRPLARLLPEGGFETYNVPCPVPPQLDPAQFRRPWLLITDFHLYNLIRKISSVREHVLVNAYPEIDTFNLDVPEWRVRDWELFAEILAKFKQSADARGVPLVLVNAPTILQVYEDEYWDEIRRSRGLGERFDLELPSRTLADVCSRIGVPFVDLLPGLKARAQEGEILYYRIYQHWNVQGNLRVAELLADFVSQHYPRERRHE